MRQSSINQVRHHQESTELQYSLVDRAVRLGWPDRVVVVDEDLGKSGNGQVERGGFQRLIAEIELGNAGLVVSLDASRLARNNRDWHQLLELCSLFGVVIADGERLYDPCAYHDRLLLGLSGIMSEAELHQIRIRLALYRAQPLQSGRDGSNHIDYIAQGLVHGRQSTEGQPWQISLSSDQIGQLQRRLQRTRRSRKGAS
ncbi:recombinase family protein [Mesorhizobium sp. C395A]|uniref:recombinase family protein n=1 Tax=Mesorhizobium sp. C395A TaxID=2956832 RepID=UPI0025750C67|nr:recombinase family protein [Mesorhizobium sp. C395A]WJI78257.1 recombinase family protein [Mesorhizobium sp. C395A]